MSCADRPQKTPVVTITIEGADGAATDAPRAVYELVEQALPMVAEGMEVAVVEVSHDLTTQQTAEILGCSRPHLIAVLESGALPYYKVGSHRRVKVRDVVEYKRRRAAEMREGLEKIVRLSEEMGLY